MNTAHHHNPLKLNAENCYLTNTPSTHIVANKLHVLEFDHYKQLSKKKCVFSNPGDFVCEVGQKFDPKPISPNSSADNLVFVFIAALALFAFILTRYWHYLTSFYESMVYKFIADKIANDMNVPVIKLSFLLDITLTLFISLFSLNTLRQFDLLSINPQSEMMIFAIVFGGFILYRLYSVIICEAIKIMVRNSAFVSRLQFDTLLTYRLMGFSLLPFTFFIYYNVSEFGQYLYFIVLGAFMLMVVYRFFRFLALFLKNGVPILYFILYLCALEVIPVLLVVKLV